MSSTFPHSGQKATRKPWGQSCVFAGLESRVLLSITIIPHAPSAQLVDGCLKIAGDFSNSAFTVGFLADHPTTLRVGRIGDYHDAADYISSLSIEGGQGNDTIILDSTITWPTTIRGGGGDDSVVGGAGNDLLDGSYGNDTLIGNDGNDTMIGGEGVNTIDGGEGNNIMRASISALTEQMRIAGTPLADEIVATADPSNSLKFVLSVNGVRHRYFFSYYPDGIWVDAGDGDDRISFNALKTKTSVFGGSGNDVILGSQAADRIVGGDGNDWIDAGSGSDTVFGEAGNDRIFGGIGSDRLFGGVGNDLIRSGDGIDHINATIGIDDLRNNKGDIVTNIVE